MEYNQWNPNNKKKQYYLALNIELGKFIYLCVSGSDIIALQPLR